MSDPTSTSEQPPTVDSSSLPAPLCRACGALAAGHYCSECGAALDGRETPSLKELLHEGVRELTDVDSALLRTFGALVARPGALTHAYLAGPRGRYLRPLKIFFMANLLFFMLAGIWGTGTFATPLRYQIQQPPASSWKAAAVARKLAAEHVDLRQLEARWDATTDAHARTLVVLMIPLYALVFGLLLCWTRRPVVHHVVFAAHFMSFYLLLLSGFVAAFAVMRVLHVPALSDARWSLIGMAMLSLYTVPAVRRGYDVGWAVAALVTLGAALAALPILWTYRTLLFFTVLPMV